ncbi:hypothetical protein IW150_001955, partial [Coemansia sp. RSA 2607]
QSKNVRTYASYLNDKVLAYKAIRIDHVTQKNPAGSQIYLKAPTDIKFMLLEVSTVQKQLHSVLKNRFDSETLDNETTFSAFRYCLRDMLKLFQVMNLGVMKMLKVYFEMREEDMRRALDLYKRFVKLTDRTDEYLKIARQFEGIFGFSIPNLTHAPLSLSKALEDFLNMPEAERRATVDEMKSVAKKPESPSSASKTSVSQSSRQQQQQQGRPQQESGSVRRTGTGGRAKPDYGLKLKPEFMGLSGSESSPPATRAQKPSQPENAKAASATTTSTQQQQQQPSASKPVKNAEIDFIDFFSSIDDETTTVTGDMSQPAYSMQLQQQQQPFGQMVATQPQQQTTMTDFDAMFNALSNPFTNPASNGNAFNNSTTFGAQQQQQQQSIDGQPFNTAFAGSMSSVGLPMSTAGNNLFAANNSTSDTISSSAQFASFSNNTAAMAPASSAMVSANNPFRQSMYPSEAVSQQLTSQMGQMSLQQQPQQNAVSYNPFTQRQTMYMDSVSSSSFGQQQQQQQQQMASPSPFGGSNTDQFAHFSTAFGSTNIPSQQQQQTPVSNVQAMQASMNNNNFANFNIFQ